MPTNTYVALATQTLSSDVASVTFSSIPSGYTDLKIVSFVRGTRGGVSDTFGMQLNGDTGTNYSWTAIRGDGSSASSFRAANNGIMATGEIIAASQTAGIYNVVTADLMNYNSSSVYKTSISRSSVSASYGAESWVALWRNTAAVTSIRLFAFSGNLLAGSTFTLYGIAATSATSSATPPVSGYNLWLDASDAATITQSSNLITQWNDKSGSGNNFTASGALRPSYISNYLQNGLNTVLFSGSQGMTTPSLPWASSAFTVFSVAKIATASGYPGILETVANAGTGIGVSGGSGYYSLFKARIAPNDFSSNAPFSTSNADLLVVKSAGMSGGAITATGYKNGTSIGTASFSGGATASAASIGYDGNVGDFANMNLCELLIYPSQLSDPNRVLVENYLKSKWGIA